VEAGPRNRGANVIRESRGPRPLERQESVRKQRPWDDRGTPGTEPAGGTTTPFVRWTIGAICFSGADAKLTTEIRPTTDMEPVYKPQDVESRIYARWLDSDVFAPDGKGSRADWSRRPFVITQPPPNITGSLHTGHALTTTVEDVMIRRARMQGYPTLWVPGVDHASIGAQVVLDKIIAVEGETRNSLGRDRYLERMWTFIDETRTLIGEQHQRLGASVDWDRLRFTMDDGSAKAVRAAFKKLYDDGLAYRGEKLVNWCPGDLTSVSDLEVIATPTKGTLWSVRYHLVGDDGSPLPDETITVATTRPETILGDTAVAVHPDDSRYTALVGRRVLIPFVDRVVPIIADDVVRQDFGTGAVKITPAHDNDDFETGKRHTLPVMDVMTDDGRINGNGGPYEGLTTEDARKRILADLDARGDLAASAEHDMVIGRCERSGHVIEPRVKTQWFIDVKPMAAKAMASVIEGRTTFVPVRHRKDFFHWMENIHDWNVSRQLWWGHRIPAWYCPDGHITVSDRIEGPAACDVCARPASDLVQEMDIFDTWFSSGLWPFSTLGWPDDTPDLRTYYPTTVMETGYDIIFFWVARMMMLGEWLTDQAPFATVYLHGIVRDPYGQKMSKSKGNVLDPLAVIEELGADALRFSLLHGPEPSQDQRMSRPRLEDARNFANKLWNAARFVVNSRPAGIPAEAVLGFADIDAESLGPAEHWILDRCAATLAAVEKAYAEFSFGEAARLLYDAIWADYCDWYVELAKIGLRDTSNPERGRAVWATLSWVLDRYLRLLHPIMPFETQEIWDRLPHLPNDADQLIVATWPSTSDTDVFADARTAQGVAQLIELVTSIRGARAESGIAPADLLTARMWLPDGPARSAYPALAEAFDRLARVKVTLVEQRETLDSPGTAALAVISPIGEARLERSDADRQAEQVRLRKEIEGAKAALASTEARLADESFVARAPQNVVEQTRRRAQELTEQIEALAARMAEG
jgi:valyl-tRNA synthetase